MSVKETFEALIRKDLLQFTGYLSARMEQNQGTLFLNANELPWGKELNRYPEQQPTALLQSLSQYYGVKSSSILATRGSDEGIDLLVRSFCQFAKDALLICPPTFGMYEVSARIQGIGVIQAPLKYPNFSLDLEEIEKVWTEKVKIIFLCSPNNPTGNRINRSDILMLCKTYAKKSLVVVDEAYLEFSEGISLAVELDDYDNLVVLRTLSKALGLAAVRVGVLIANEELVSFLKNILAPYPLPVLSIQSVIKTLDIAMQPLREQRIKTIKEERDKLINSLQQLEITQTVWPSQANFILIQFKKSIENFLIEKGIIFRNMEKRLGMRNVMRITVGTPKENCQLIKMMRLL